MQVAVLIHEAQEGGYWAEAPAIPGCLSQGETLEEVKTNITEAIAGCLSASSLDAKAAKHGTQGEVLTLSV
ncbi:MAG: type II toxin-antitoxin system HicB family antitoxin [Chloroflexi bacterium]|nr:type II toxin-antitoxin system HicB family antitoxin [Chloroflexota bacterium]